MRKPECRIICNQGNDTSYLIKMVEKSLRKSGLKEQANDFVNKVGNLDYDDILKLCLENVEFCFVFK